MVDDVIVTHGDHGGEGEVPLHHTLTSWSTVAVGFSGKHLCWFEGDRLNILSMCEPCVFSVSVLASLQACVCVCVYVCACVCVCACVRDTIPSSLNGFRVKLV